LTAKISRQPPAPISAPPIVGPSAGAANSMIPAATEIDRALPPLPSSMDIASGTSGAAASPCRARNAISAPMPGDSAHSADAAVNAARLTRYTGTVPNRRARYAVPASPVPSASKYPLTVHCTVPSEACSARAIGSAATLTMLESTMDSSGPASSAYCTTAAAGPRAARSAMPGPARAPGPVMARLRASAARRATRARPRRGG
jgi:hypothetical protein